MIVNTPFLNGRPLAQMVSTLQLNTRFNMWQSKVKIPDKTNTYKPMVPHSQLPSVGTWIYFKNLPNHLPKYVQRKVTKIIGLRIVEVEYQGRKLRVHLHQFGYSMNDFNNTSDLNNNDNQYWIEYILSSFEKPLGPDRKE